MQMAYYQTLTTRMQVASPDVMICQLGHNLEK